MKQVWRPDIRTWGLSEANVEYWRKYLWHCWDFSAPPAVIRRPRSDSAPGELCPISLLVTPLPACRAILLRVDRSQLHRFGNVTRMSHEKLASWMLLATPKAKLPRCQPKTRWRDYISQVLGPVLLWTQRIYKRLLKSTSYFESS